MQKLIFLLLCICAINLANAQKGTIKGLVKDNEGNAIIGANISTSPGNVGTITEVDGSYSISVVSGTYSIKVSFVGYTSQVLNVFVDQGEIKTLDFTLSDDAVTLSDVVVVGTRAAPRSNTTSPLPVDVFSGKDLLTTGQTTFDKALQYRVPSFNTVQTPVNDATSLLDPYEIRNMGPSRTLILINGKRKNMSALVYTQTAPGRGETGADISAIPADAIKRVEILRDGASAQYGSDAIAGVMNVILKDDYDGGSVTINTGITHKGDGEALGITLNQGAKIGNKGFINYTANFGRVGLANRPGILSVKDEAEYWGVSEAVTKKFLDKFPDGGHVNGAPETKSAKFSANAGVDLTSSTRLYANAAYVYKRVNSFANYRAPYWITTDFGLLTPAGQEYIGYVPTFDGDLNDYNGTLGFINEKNGWKTDVSFTTGGNAQIYTVLNTYNRSLGAASPIQFRPGGYKFNHNVENIDISKVLTEKISFAVGSEVRVENFEILEGDEASWIKGPLDAPAGANSFPGTRPENSGLFTRFNLGAYADFNFDLTDDFLVAMTGRLENYSDFGNAFVWKASTRYKFNDDKVTLRASASTGFRAPTLHQINLQTTQASFVDGVIKETGIFRNGSAQIKQLGVPTLAPEKSFNFTAGIGLKPSSDFSLTFDYFNITVNDRILLSSVIRPTGNANNPLDKILTTNEVAGIQFFTNGINTRTSGIDLVLGYRGLQFGGNQIGINLSGNYMLSNEKLELKEPKIISDAKKSIFDPTQEALMLTSRPQYKAILGLDYNVGKFGFSLNNTLFGPTKFRLADFSSTTDLEQQFIPKVVTDLGIIYKVSDKTTINFNIGNIFNVLPEFKVVGLTPAGEAIVKDAAKLKSEMSNITFNGRYPVTAYDGSHFSQLGTLLNLAINFKF
jgi:iron complex outermembrane receptor protein